MSLLTAARVCFTGTGARKTIAVPELPALWPALEDCARGFYRVTSGGARCRSGGARRATVENDVDIRIASPRRRGRRWCSTPRAPAAPVGPADGGRGADRDRCAHVPGPEGAAPRRRRPSRSRSPRRPEAPGTPPLPGFRAYLRLGVEHILTGTDHLLFLLGLLVVCRRFRTVAAIITCFTVAHSVTLALAALES